MKKLLIILISSTIIVLTYGCSTQTDPLPEHEMKKEFSFTFNGQDYLFPDDKFTNVTVESFLGKFSFTLNMINVFGGEVYFDNDGCGYLAPDNYTIYKNWECMLTSQENGHIVPIDGTKVFTYQSGYLNVTLSHCQVITEREGLTEYSYTTCIASGTFELTLANNNNETIEITNGTIANFDLNIK